MVIGSMLGLLLHTLGVGASAPREPGVEVAGALLSRTDDVGPPALDALRRGVLRVEAAGCGDVRQASATVVNAGGEIVVLTNAHVVRGSGTVTLRAADGTPLAARVLGSVAGRDAALLAVDAPLPDAVEPLDQGPEPGAGDRLVVAGHPADVPTAAGGTVVSRERRAGYGGSSDVLVVDTPVDGGSSGGAVLDEQGRVVGLVAAKDPGSGFAVAYPIGDVLGLGLGAVPTC